MTPDNAAAQRNPMDLYHQLICAALAAALQGDTLAQIAFTEGAERLEQRLVDELVGELS